MNEPAESQLLRLIPLLPLMGAVFHGLVIGVVRRSSPRGFVIALSCGFVFLSFAISCWALVELLQLPSEGRLLVDHVSTWIGAGVGEQALSADLAFQLDALSAVMILVVTGVGFLIHVYSIGYMDDDHRDDKGFQRFFCYLNLFMFSMLVLVLADNLVLMFLGWEGVGLCSYLLIGFWYGDRWNAYCGSKAFLVNRIGDLGFLVGLFALFWALVDAGTPALDFRSIEQHIGALADRTVAVPAWLGGVLGSEWHLLTVIGLCFFLGACGKSAQIPLYTWLPDAMAGPTPVSALIHAATMVTAGVYLVCRMGFLYDLAPVAASVIAWTGGITALFAATIAIAQTDIKKVLAYSTVSQLGYMFLAAGCGAYSTAIFHLGTHAFFKALLFLAAGAVILAMHHEQDVTRMGGLARKIPRTHVVFLIGVLAISGCPPLSGFFSKDAILLSAYTADAVPYHLFLYAIALVTAGITAFYMVRLLCRTFYGETHAPPEVRAHMRDPGDVVVVPLYWLAGLSIVAGVFGVPQAWGELVGVKRANSLDNFLAPVLPELGAHAVEHSTEYLLALLTIGVAGAGAALAWLLYVRRPDLPDRIARQFATVYRTLVRKYYVDEIYDALLVRPLVFVSDRVLFRAIDAAVIDGLVVNGMARSVRAIASHGLKYAQTGLAQGYLFLMLVGTVAIVAYLLR